MSFGDLKEFICHWTSRQVRLIVLPSSQLVKTQKLVDPASSKSVISLLAFPNKYKTKNIGYMQPVGPIETSKH